MPRKILETPLQKAARLYSQEKNAYRAALAATEVIPDPDVRKWATEALTARVRGKFGAIGRGLTESIGCHLSAVPNGNTEPTENEHAIPLNLIHNRILGINANGGAIENLIDEYVTHEEIATFLSNFVIGVKVTRTQHGKLKKKDMPEGWNWLIRYPAWHWNEILHNEWDHAARPAWLIAFMGRYESVHAPHGPIKYWPIGRAVPGAEIDKSDGAG